MPLEVPTLSAAAGWFTLSTSEAEEEGDSPKRQCQKHYNRKKFQDMANKEFGYLQLAYLAEPFAEKSAIHFGIY